jgi:hypothetical protein
MRPTPTGLRRKAASKPGRGGKPVAAVAPKAGARPAADAPQLSSRATDDGWGQLRSRPDTLAGEPPARDGEPVAAGEEPDGWPRYAAAPLMVEPTRETAPSGEPERVSVEPTSEVTPVPVLGDDEVDDPSPAESELLDPPAAGTEAPQTAGAATPPSLASEPSIDGDALAGDDPLPSAAAEALPKLPDAPPEQDAAAGESAAGGGALPPPPGRSAAPAAGRGGEPQTVEALPDARPPPAADPLPPSSSPPAVALPVATWQAADALGPGALGAPASTPAEGAAFAEAADASARADALRAYATAAATARARQAMARADAARAVEAMAREHAMRDREARGRHASAISAVDRDAGQQALDLEIGIDQAEVQLEQAHRRAQGAAGAAATRAKALITTRVEEAGVVIGERVTDLKANHATKFKGYVDRYRRLVQDAVDALLGWSDGVEDSYPVTGAEPMAGAINEKLRAVIPKMATRRVRQFGDDETTRKNAWETRNAAALCKTPCSYEAAMNKAVTETYGGGHAAIDTALARARRQLRSRYDAAREQLARHRQSALARIYLRQRGQRAQVTGQTQATLSGLHGRSQSAMATVASAARTALPVYWQSLGSVRQSLAAAAAAGAEALRRTTVEAPASALKGLDASASLARSRFDGQHRQLATGLGEQVADLDRSHVEAQRGGQASPLGIVGEAAEGCARIVDSHQRGTASGVTAVQAAAAPYAPTVEVRLGASFDGSRAQAVAGLDALFIDSGGGDQSNAADQGDKGGKTGDSACADCASAGSGDNTATGSGGGGVELGIESQLKGEEKRLKPFLKPATEKDIVAVLFGFESQVWKDVVARVDNALNALDAGVIDKVAEEKVTGALRGMSAARGRAVDAKDYAQPPKPGTTLTENLAAKMNVKGKDYLAAIAYIAGNQQGGAKLELQASVGILNDQEDRIEETLRALSPTDAQAVAADPTIRDEVRDALGGVDGEVFDALGSGEPDGAIRADALRMKEKVDQARRDVDGKAAQSAIEAGNTLRPQDWNARQLEDLEPKERSDAEALHRTAVARQLGKLIVEGKPALKGTADALGGDQAARDALYQKEAIAFVRDAVKPHRPPPRRGRTGKPPPPREAMSDLAEALLLEGRGSVKAKAATLGIELERGGKPREEKIAEVLHDEAFAPPLPLPEDASPEEREAWQRADARAREQARIRKAEVLVLAASKYAGGDPADSEYRPEGKAKDNIGAGGKPADPVLAAAQARLIEAFGNRTGGGKWGEKRAQLISGLIREDRPSAKTASLAMQVGLDAELGTNEALINGFTARMTRSEIAAMETQYSDDTWSLGELDGRSLRADLASDFSCDDRLENERNLRGLARTDQEKSEAAVFAIRQQRRETGGLGRAFASGSHAEAVLAANERRLYRTMNVKPGDFDRDGRLKPGRGDFDASGKLKGDDRALLLATGETTQAAVQAYSATVDRYANAATTTIAVAGAIAAGAIATFVTGGAAGPLVAAALISGLASMTANYAIKGGRYGWEQAGIDLGMTLVQAATAGIGAKLGAAAQLAQKGGEAVKTASRSLQVLSKLFGKNPVVNQIIAGTLTGTFGSTTNLMAGVAGSALDDKTWSKTGGDIALSMLGGLLKGALSGASTAAMTQTIEALGRRGAALRTAAEAFAKQGGALRGIAGAGGKLVGGGAGWVGRGLAAQTGGGLRASARAIVHRGSAKAISSGLSGMVGRGTELAWDKADGKFKGRIEDAFEEIGKAGLQNAIQGFGEGGFEAGGAAKTAGIREQLGKDIAAERAARGLDPLDAIELRNAAEELHLLNQFAADGDAPAAKVAHLDHVAEHGGIDVRRLDVPANGKLPDDDRSRLERDMPGAAARAVPRRVVDDDTLFAGLAGDPALEPLPGVDPAHALLRQVGEGVELVLRKGIDMRTLARAGRALADALGDGTVGRLQARQTQSLPGDDGGVAQARWDGPQPLPSPGGDIDAPRATATEVALAGAARLLMLRPRGAARIAAATADTAGAASAHGTAAVVAALRSAWRAQGQSAAVSRRQLRVIVELAQPVSPRVRDLLGPDPAASAAAARALLVAFGDHDGLTRLLAVADPALTPTLHAAARRLEAFRGTVQAVIDGTPGGRDPASRDRALLAGQLARVYGPEWARALGLRLHDAPAANIGGADPISAAAITARAAGQASAAETALNPAERALDRTLAALRREQTWSLPQRGLRQGVRALHEVLVQIGLARPGPDPLARRDTRLLARKAIRGIASLSDRDAPGEDYATEAQVVRLVEAWQKQASFGADGERRLAVVHEMLLGSSARARALLGDVPNDSGQAALGLLREFGSYEQLMSMVSAADPALAPTLRACAKKIEAYRGEVVKAIALRGGKPLGSASARLNSDVDISFSGDDAGRRLIDTEAEMVAAFGPDWERMLTMNFYVDAGRLTAASTSMGHLDPARQELARRELTRRALAASIGRLKSDIHDSPEGLAHVDAMARELGVDSSRPEARPDLDRGTYRDKRNAALIEQDRLAGMIRAAQAAGDLEAVAELSVRLTLATMRGNRYSTEAYIGAGSVQLTLKGGGSIKGQEPEIALQSFIGDFENLVHKVYKHGRSVEDGLRDYTTYKYMTRMVEALEVAQVPARMKAKGLAAPMLDYFRHLGEYLYKGNREGGFASAFLYASSDVHQTAAGPRLSDLPQEVGGLRPTPGKAGYPKRFGAQATDAALRRDFDDFMTLMLKLAPELADAVGKPAPPPEPLKPIRPDHLPLQPKVIINLSPPAPATASGSGSKPQSPSGAESGPESKPSPVAKPAAPTTPAAQAAGVDAAVRAGLDALTARLLAAPSWTIDNLNKALVISFDTPEIRQQALVWAWARCRGNLHTFQTHVEYAAARHRLLVADGSGAADLARRLDAGLDEDAARIGQRAPAGRLDGPIAAMSEAALFAAVRALPVFGFSSATHEAYHAHKHLKEVPSTFVSDGNPVDRHYAAATDTITAGALMPLAHGVQDSGSRKLVIHKQYPTPEGTSRPVWREALIHVQPDGTVHLSSWGDCKEVRRADGSGHVTAQGLSRLEPVFSAALQAQQEQERAAKAAKKQAPPTPSPKPGKGGDGGAVKRDRLARDDQARKDDQVAKDASRKAKRKPGGDPDPEPEKGD